MHRLSRATATSGPAISSMLVRRSALLSACRTVSSSDASPPRTSHVHLPTAASAGATGAHAAASAPPPAGDTEKTFDVTHAPAMPELDAEAAEQVRLAQNIGEQAFGENTEILKQVGYRGLRAFVVCAIGLATLMWAMKKKKKELAAAAAAAANGRGDEDDPTQRYLQEMRDLGFDVDTLEEELELERLTKLGAAPIKEGGLTK